MTVKMSGAEFKRFYNDPSLWPEDTWHEDAAIEVDGIDQPDGVDVDNLSDTAKISITGGVLFGPQWEDEGPSLETYFKRWRKKQTTCVLIVECDQSDIEAVKLALKQAGARVV